MIESPNNIPSEDASESKAEEVVNVCNDVAEIKLVRIQGIEPKLEIPFSWVVNNLMNPDYFLYISLYVKVANLNTA